MERRLYANTAQLCLCMLHLCDSHIPCPPPTKHRQQQPSPVVKLCDVFNGHERIRSIGASNGTIGVGLESGSLLVWERGEASAKSAAENYSLVMVAEHAQRADRVFLTQTTSQQALDCVLLCADTDGMVRLYRPSPSAESETSSHAWGIVSECFLGSSCVQCDVVNVGDGGAGTAHLCVYSAGGLLRLWHLAMLPKPMVGGPPTPTRTTDTADHARAVPPRLEQQGTDLEPAARSTTHMRQQPLAASLRPPVQLEASDEVRSDNTSSGVPLPDLPENEAPSTILPLPRSSPPPMPAPHPFTGSSPPRDTKHSLRQHQGPTLEEADSLDADHLPVPLPPDAGDVSFDAQSEIQKGPELASPPNKFLPTGGEPATMMPSDMMPNRYESGALHSTLRAEMRLNELAQQEFDQTAIPDTQEMREYAARSATVNPNENVRYPQLVDIDASLSDPSESEFRRIVKKQVSKKWQETVEQCEPTPEDLYMPDETEYALFTEVPLETTASFITHARRKQRDTRQRGGVVDIAADFAKGLSGVMLSGQFYA